MQAKKIDVTTLTVPEILSLLEIFEDFWGTRPDWKQLEKKLSSQESWLLLDGKNIVGCAQLFDAYSLLEGAMLLTEFVYRWEYNTEDNLLEMLRVIVSVCPPSANSLLLEVDRKHECNFACYRRFGFRESLLCSRNGRGYVVLLKPLSE